MYYNVLIIRNFLSVKCFIADEGAWDAHMIENPYLNHICNIYKYLCNIFWWGSRIKYIFLRKMLNPLKTEHNNQIS